MADAISIRTGQIPHEKLAKLDLVCESFERAWSDGVSPRIETLLEQFEPSLQPLVLRELLWIEWACLRREGDSPSSETYQSRFEQQSDVVRDAWDVDRKRCHSLEEDGDARGDRFRILRPHARGGLGQVFVAKDQEVGREVALKEIRAGFDQDSTAQQRLLREAQITGRLQHPGIVPVLGLGRDEDGRPYYAMPLISGRSMSVAIAEFHQSYQKESGETVKKETRQQSVASTSKDVPDAADRISAFLRENISQEDLAPSIVRLPKRAYSSRALRQLLSRFSYVCNAIEHAHEQGVLHRDLKPSNIMLGSHGETIVVDWGLAKATNDTDVREASDGVSSSPTSMKTEQGTLLGTPGYMSPEQALVLTVEPGPASDLYSLGATLYHILSGMRPNFVTETTEEEVAPLESLQPNVPPALQSICVKAMAWHPEDRYGSCAELACDVDNWLADEPVTSHKPSWAHRLARRMRRHQVATAAIVVGMLGLALTLAAAASVTVAKNRDLAKQRDTANSLSDFLIDVLGSPHPDVDGRLLTVAEKLDVAFEQLQTRDDILPDTKAKMLMTLAESYSGLGKFESVAKVVDYAIDQDAQPIGGLQLPREERFKLLTLHANAEGEKGLHLKALTNLENLLPEIKADLKPENALIYQVQADIVAYQVELGLPDLALTSAQGGLVEANANLAENHPAILKLELEKGRALSKLDRFQEAIEIIEEVIQRSEKDLGPMHSSTLRAKNELGIAYIEAARDSESIEVHLAAFEERSELLGPNHLHTLHARDSLATAYLQAGKYAEALKEYQATLQLRNEHFGPEHPSSIMTRAGIGDSFAKQGKFAEAVEWLSEAHRRQVAYRGERNFDSLSILQQLAFSIMESGFPDKALKLLESAKVDAEAMYGEEINGATAEIMSSLAICYKRLGRREESLRIYEAIIPAREKQVGAEHRMVIGLKISYAMIALSDARRRQQAIKMVEALVPTIEKRMGRSHFWHIVCQRSLAIVYSNTNFKKCLEIYLSRKPEEDLGWNTPIVTEWYLELAKAYFVSGKQEMTEKTFAALLQNLEEHCGPDSSQLLRAKEGYAAYLENTGDRERAKALNQELVDSFERTLGPFNENTIRAHLQLTGIVRNLYEWKEAEPEIKRLVERLRGMEAPNETLLAEQLGVLANAQLKAKKWEEARSNLEEALGIQERISPEEFLTTTNYLLLGDALIGLGQLEKAEEVIIPAMERFLLYVLDHPNGKNGYLDASEKRVTALYEALGHPEKAEPYLEKIAVLRSMVPAPSRQRRGGRRGRR